MELREYVAVVRSRRGLVIGAVILFALVAVTANLLRQPDYSAQARVLVAPGDAASSLLGVTGGTSSFQPDRELKTHAQLAMSPSIAAEAAKQMKSGASGERLLSQVSVEPIEASDLLAFTATDPDRARAARIANAFAAAYVARLEAEQKASIEAASAELQRQRKEVHAELDAVGGSDSGQAAAEREVSIAALTRINEQLDRLKTGGTLELGGARLVDPATAPAPVAPLGSLIPSLILGGALGLAIGMGAAFTAHHFDTSVRSSRDVADLGVGVLGGVPADGSGRGGAKLALLRDPNSASADAYRLLRRSVHAASFSGNTMLVAGIDASEGAASVASNLAVALAQAGERVALVDCDFRRSPVRALFELQGSSGLTDVINGVASVQDVAQYPLQQRLLVVPAGAPPTNAADALGSYQLQQVLRELSGAFDRVVLSGPPLLESAEGAYLVDETDALLAVAVVGFTRKERIETALDLIGHARGRTRLVVWGTYGGRRGVDSFLPVGPSEPVNVMRSAAAEAPLVQEALAR